MSVGDGIPFVGVNDGVLADSHGVALDFLRYALRVTRFQLQLYRVHEAARQQRGCKHYNKKMKKKNRIAHWGQKSNDLSRNLGEWWGFESNEELNGGNRNGGRQAPTANSKRRNAELAF